MAEKTIEMSKAFETMPEIPEIFVKHCRDDIPGIPIFYKRIGKRAECVCGKCGVGYSTKEIPRRGDMTTCNVCGHRGRWEWKRETRRRYNYDDITLVQCTTDKNLVLRIFRISWQYQQDYEAEINLNEKRRYFLRMGDVYRFYNTRQYDYVKGQWNNRWGRKSDHEMVNIEKLSVGYLTAIKESNLRYCDPGMLAGSTKWQQWDYGTALITYAMNPAIEMFAKTGMRWLVVHLIEKGGRTSLINRRGKTIYSQLRIKDKEALNRLIKEEGSVNMLKVLQIEKKRGSRFTEQQRVFLKGIMGSYKGKETVDFLLRFMSLQQLINRVDKYIKQDKYSSSGSVLIEYKDYLEMREELGYDMTNEVYLYPKSLKEKHLLMVKERNAKKDELHAVKMQEKYPNIEKQFKVLCKRYGYSDENYVIRPAKDAAEIVNEGRELHHCVGRENYLSKHNRGETFILFLRKKEAPNTPCYTIEIRENKILQWYGVRDGKPDEEIIEPWLDEYVNHLSNGKRQEVSMLAAAV